MSDKIALKVQAIILKRNVERERKHGKHREKVMRQHKGICHLCNKEYSDTIDHIVPVKCGGSDHPMNLRPAHGSCNSSKGARHYPLWAHEHEEMWLPDWLPQPLVEKAEKEKAAKKAAKEAERLAREAEFARVQEEHFRRREIQMMERREQEYKELHDSLSQLDHERSLSLQRAQDLEMKVKDFQESLAKARQSFSKAEEQNLRMQERLERVKEIAERSMELTGPPWFYLNCFASFVLLVTGGLVFFLVCALAWAGILGYYFLISHLSTAPWSKEKREILAREYEWAKKNRSECMQALEDLRVEINMSKQESDAAGRKIEAIRKRQAEIKSLSSSAQIVK